MTNILFLNFLTWFWVIQPKRIVVLGRNLLLWGWRFFSIGYLSTRLFSPWHRDLTSYGRGLDFKRILTVLGWNMTSRVLGALMRIIVIAMGLVVEAIIAVTAVVVVAAWVILPLIILFLFFNGLRLLLGI